MSAFETAVIDSKKLTSKPSNDDLLALYGALLYTALGSVLTIVCRIVQGCDWRGYYQGRAARYFRPEGTIFSLRVIRPSKRLSGLHEKKVHFENWD
jgi:hypothetical protein